LTDVTIPVPDADSETGRVPPTYVPFRNAGFLSAAVSWAEVIEAGAVFVGAVEEDSSGYPDCRQSFFESFQAAVNMGTREGKVIIRTPLLHKTKEEIVKLGISLSAPFGDTWSCYRRMDSACGTCASCALRLRGFKQAGIKDPIPYLAHAVP
jgi:7-cyano-7-deazaguanine synthase